MTEEWLDINGFEGYYQVSNLGYVKSLQRVIHHKNGSLSVRERILIRNSGTKGYLTVGLCRDGVHLTKRIHILVALAFIPNPKNKPEVNHKDGNKSNCCASNLEWATTKENSDHATKNGLRGVGSRARSAILTEEDIPIIRRELADGDPLDLVAFRHKVSARSIGAIRRGESWKHIPIEE
jgi:hypothetical protein